jgi:hypothetical protein
MLIDYMRTHHLDNSRDLGDLLEEHSDHPWLSLSYATSEDDIRSYIETQGDEDERDDSYDYWIHMTSI